MTIPKFIEKAIEGGWNPDVSVYRMKLSKRTISAQMEIAGEFYKAWFLDPEAWKAVGKVIGKEVSPTGPFDETNQNYTDKERDEIATFVAKTYMHRMIDALAEGKTIEQFIETL